MKIIQSCLILARVDEVLAYGKSSHIQEKFTVWLTCVN